MGRPLKLGEPTLPLLHEPGHLMRRAHQWAVFHFHDTHGRHVTPVQYAILRALQDQPGIDQVTLAQRVALDTSTTADIAARLETKGWILRHILPRRQRSLHARPCVQHNHRVAVLRPQPLHVLAQVAQHQRVALTNRHPALGRSSHARAERVQALNKPRRVRCGHALPGLVHVLRAGNHHKLRPERRERHSRLVTHKRPDLPRKLIQLVQRRGSALNRHLRGQLRASDAEFLFPLAASARRERAGRAPPP